MAVTTTTVAASCAAAKKAARTLASASTEAKNAALQASARLLEERTAEILEANAADLSDERAAGLTEALKDRLALSAERVAAMAKAYGWLPTSTIRSVRSSNAKLWPVASTCARSGCHWGSSPSSTRRGRT